MPREAEFKSTPFQEAIDFFQSKVRVPTRAYTDLMNQAHSRAFMVAGAMRDDLLCDLQEAIGKAFTAGNTLADFRKAFDSIVAKYGWAYKGGRNWRTRVIYDTNIRTAYSAGHWQQMQAAKKMRPYGRYVHGQSIHPREQHLAWNGKIVPLDDPWWNYRWPPNGWGCKCSVTSVSEKELERNGWTVEHPEPDETITATVNTPDGPMKVETVDGVDPSFAYNPGKSATGIRLSPQKIEEAKADGTWKNWKPVPWGSRTMETWESLNRPTQIPIDRASADIAEKVDSESALRPIIEKMIGGQEAFLTAADGTIVWLSADSLMHIKPTRSPYVPFIPELLAHPYEVWMDFEEHEVTGRVELKKRYLKRIDTGEKKMGMLMVVQVIKGQFAGWTFIPAERGNYLNNVRRGKLIWAREE